LGKNLFFKGVFFGALVGGALSLLHKETRRDVMNASKKTINQIKYVVTHPVETAEKIQYKVTNFVDSIEEISDDLKEINDRIHHIKTVPGTTRNMSKNVE